MFSSEEDLPIDIIHVVLPKTFSLEKLLTKQILLGAWRQEKPLQFPGEKMIGRLLEAVWSEASASGRNHYFTSYSDGIKAFMSACSQKESLASLYSGDW